MNICDQLKEELGESLNNVGQLPKGGIPEKLTIKVDGDEGIETIKDASISKNKKGWLVAKKDGVTYISKDGKVYMQADNSLSESNVIDNEFVDYFNSFYGPDGIYKKANKVKRPYTLKELQKALELRDKDRKFPFEGDSTDRETLRDRMIDMKLLNPDY